MGSVSRNHPVPAPTDHALMLGRIIRRCSRETLRWMPIMEEPAQPWKPDVEPVELEAPIPWTEASTAFDGDYLPDETLEQLEYLLARLAEHVRLGLGESYRQVEVVVVEGRPTDMCEDSLPLVELEPATTPGVGRWTDRDTVHGLFAQYQDEWIDGVWDDWARRERGGRLYT